LAGTSAAEQGHQLKYIFKSGGITFSTLIVGDGSSSIDWATHVLEITAVQVEKVENSE